jgi:integrase
MLVYRVYTTSVRKMHGLYFLYRRKLKSGIIWYYKTYRPDGTLTCGRSTGCRTKSSARAYCDDLLQKGLLDNGSTLLFGTYAGKWFNDGSPWLEDKISEGTKDKPSISASTIISYRQALQNHILPFFAKSKMYDIKPSNIKHFRTELIQAKGLSRKTVNNIVGVMRIITDYALADSVIMFDPFRGIKPLRIENDTRDAFTYEEAVKIFNSDWQNDKAKIASLVAAITGMRISEIFAINKQSLYENYIDVKQQLYRGTLCPCKTKEKRKVPIPECLYNLLMKEIKKSGKDFCFEELNATAVLRQLNRILFSLGMEKAKEERQLCNHSWRHFFNTYLLANNVTEIKVKAIMGHSSGKGTMTDRYTNWRPDMFPEVYAIQEQLFNSFYKEQ